MSTAEFKFPAIHDFPPFYTKQVNERTWQSQLANWDSLILDYCRHNKVWALESNPEHELFCNNKINRKLKPNTLKQIFDYMIKQGHAERLDSSVVLIYFKSTTEWANEINQWINDTGQNGTVLTLYEISQGDLALNKDFHGIHEAVLKKVLDILVSQNKAVYMKSNDSKIAGVKML